MTTGNNFTISFLKTSDLRVVALGDNHTISIDALDANTLGVDSLLQGSKIKSLAINGGHVRTAIRVGALNLDLFSTQGSEIGKLILLGTRINDGIDLSLANINSLSWAMGNVGAFPQRSGNNLAGLKFKDIQITRNSDPSKIDDQATSQPQTQHLQPTKVSQNPEAEEREIATTSLEFLNRSRYSASAYEALESLLSSRGDSKADDVFVSGREAKRWSEVTWRRPLSFLAFVVDLFQEYVLGYGRMARYPMFWSAVIILIGYFAFRCDSKVQRMELTDIEKYSGSKYSPFWYSFELFVPVIDIGVAKKWQPKPVYRLLVNYAHLHQIAGWILVPITLATLTGLTK